MSPHPDDDQLDEALRGFLDLRGRPTDDAMGPAEMASRVAADLSRGGRRRTRAARQAVAVLASLILISSGIAAVATLGGVGSSGGPAGASSTPASRSESPAADLCPQVRGAPPPADALPRTDAPSTGAATNGSIAVADGDGINLVDPVSGATDHPAGLGDRAGVYREWNLLGWSPDGRWLAATRHNSTTADSYQCVDVVIASADGGRLEDVTASAFMDTTVDAAWSPDGRWLAVATSPQASALTNGSFIDVAAVGATGVLGDRRRVWAGDTSIDDLDWGADGTLVWSTAGTIEVLRAGATSAQSIDLVSADPIGGWGIWMSPDGKDLLVRSGPGIDHIGLPSGKVERLALPVALQAGMSLYDDDRPIASVGGRILFTAISATAGGDDPARDIYSVNLDGTDLQDLTSFPIGRQAYIPIVSPDQSQLAFVATDIGPPIADDVAVWGMAVDGTGLHRLFSTSWPARIAWRPMP